MSNRRNFLQQAGIAAAAAILSPSVLSSAMAAEKLPSHKVGIQLYTLREQLLKDVKGTISKVAKIGYDQVETFYGYPGPNAAPGFWGLDAKAFKSLLTANHLSSPSGHYNANSYFIEGGNDETIKQYIEVAATVGQKYFVIPSIPHDPAKASTSDYFKEIAAKFNHAAGLCKNHGLKLGYHNHNFEFTDLGNGVTPFDILLKETDPSMVSFELDLFWAVNAGVNPLEMFKLHPGRFKMWHVKDMDKADKKVFTEVGTGSIDFKSIFKQAKLSGMEYLFVEQDVIKIDPYQSITKSINYIKKDLLS
ncbi:Tat (twin-arginine translocation) pathway signal sequence [Pedobacter westerhofensis]|uniref:Tat (Twin-arginine translocation) pathway signal sequence n=1 Tax=Pedobacter westerhofensis TaxID=425512 RepID=A0A521BVH2_9SPHI|nr:sugar phosphate isomerase/epimerase [Pedobacter westerhofensis]SMO51194.1 Tat (twin-arginine translocation) pathway signal sequence [Pedobacter westerhofensis]